MLKRLFSKKAAFDSKNYWEDRYRSGGTSGSGSYNNLAQFKNEVINELLDRYQVSSVIEFGCGDGNQLVSMQYKRYLGLDVSARAVQLCAEKFAHDNRKSFLLYDGEAFADPAGFLRADASFSLDVLYHLVETPVYERYIKHLFTVAVNYVVVYSTNEELPQFGGHERHRMFTKDVERLVTGWEIAEVIKNKYPVAEFGEENGSRADFFIYKKK